MSARTPGRTASLVEFAARLRNRPGHWEPHPYRPAAAQSAASRIRNGHTAAFGRGFTAQVTDTGDVLVAYQPPRRIPAVSH